MTTEDTEKVTEICRIFGIKNERTLLPNISKIEHVLRCVPRLESILREITVTIFPELERHADQALCSEKLESLTETLKQIIHRLSQLKHFKYTLCSTLGISRSTKAEAILAKISSINNEHTGLQRLRTLFEVHEDEDTSKLIGELFLFTHEIKSFLKQAKSYMYIEEEQPLSTLLELILMKIMRRT